MGAEHLLARTDVDETVPLANGIKSNWGKDCEIQAYEKGVCTRERQMIEDLMLYDKVIKKDSQIRGEGFQIRW